MPHTQPFRAVAVRVALLLGLLALFASSCSVDLDEVMTATDGSPASDDSSQPLTAPSISGESINETTCGTGLTEVGTRLLATGRSSQQPLPAYELEVTIDPTVGSVNGSMAATIVADDDEMKFRVFAGMRAFESNLQIDNVTIDGTPVSFVVNEALLTVVNPVGPGETVAVGLDFSFAISQMAANESLLGSLTGDTLQPDQVGLLGRTESGMQLGHWFPVWLPDGTRTDADPSGFGDIGAFPAASICATIQAPPEYSIITGGVRLGTTDDAIIEGALGIRDFSILLSNDIEMVKGTVDGVEVRVWGPPQDRESLQTVLGYSLTSQQALVDAFGPYPWTEIDIVSAPLGGGVGGMEWPGMVWVERSMFAGGLPGMADLGGLGDLFGDLDLGSLLGGIGGIAIETTLEWTVAHELGHEWFHAMVGNDSIASPAVDEPLAQFAACVAMQQIHPANWQEICDAQTTDQYAQARALGIADTAADQASDEFDSSTQYGAVVYGKAPGFYFATAELIGWDSLVAALAEFVDEHAFTLVSTDTLRDHLVRSAGADGDTVDDLWQRWFSEARGDDDIESSDAFGGLEGFGGLDGLEGLGDLFGEDSPFGSGSPIGPGGELDFEQFFGEDSLFGSFEDGALSQDDLQQFLEDLLGG